MKSRSGCAGERSPPKCTVCSARVPQHRSQAATRKVERDNDGGRRQQQVGEGHHPLTASLGRIAGSCAAVRQISTLTATGEHGAPSGQGVVFIDLDPAEEDGKRGTALGRAADGL